MASTSKAWPTEKRKTVDFTDLAEPVCEAIHFAYDLSRKNHDRDIPWNGYDIGEQDLASCPSPHIRLQRDNLEYDEKDQGRDALRVLVAVAVQLGIEQGRRMEHERGTTGRDLARILAEQVLEQHKEESP